MSQSAVEIPIWGVHPVEEALSSPFARVLEILVSGRFKEGEEMPVLARAREKRIPVRTVSAETLSQKTGTDKHQNIAALVSLNVWDTAKDWWAAHASDRDVTVLAVDGVQDPQNLGSLIRSAHFFGVDLFLLTRDRSAPITGVVAKASAGALFSMPIVRATNLARELEELGEKGVFRVALDQEGEKTLRDMDLKGGSLAIVIGGEGQGIRTLTAKRCDAVAKLTSKGGRDSLNAAIAGAIGLYELSLQRAKR
jgi:23S rRNA (guanosine2251-2'-O)-methyltransferase